MLLISRAQIVRAILQMLCDCHLPGNWRADRIWTATMLCIQGEILFLARHSGGVIHESPVGGCRILGTGGHINRHRNNSNIWLIVARFQESGNFPNFFRIVCQVRGLSGIPSLDRPRYPD